jgi:6-phosphogluconate dehydrogenase
MPGGTRAAYGEIEHIVTKIAAQVDDGPCVTYIGPGGAGHYVKMVHNGIEYGDMQLIAEAYDLMKNVLGLDHAQLHEVFAEWNLTDELNSFLIEITADIFHQSGRRDRQALGGADCGRSGSKGHRSLDRDQRPGNGGRHPHHWRSGECPHPMSSIKSERVAASKQLSGPSQRFDGDAKAIREQNSRCPLLLQDLLLRPGHGPDWCRLPAL